MGGLSNGPIPTPHVPFSHQTGGSLVTGRLDVDENVSRTHFRIHWLVVEVMQFTIVQLSPKP